MSSHVRVTACIAKARESGFFNQRTFMPILTPHLALIKPIQSDFPFWFHDKSIFGLTCRTLEEGNMDHVKLLFRIVGKP